MLITLHGGVNKLHLSLYVCRIQEFTKQNSGFLESPFEAFLPTKGHLFNFLVSHSW